MSSSRQAYSRSPETENDTPFSTGCLRRGEGVLTSSSPAWITFEAFAMHSKSSYTCAPPLVLEFTNSITGRQPGVVWVKGFAPRCRRKLSQKCCLWGNGCPRWQSVERVVLLVAFCFAHDDRHNHGRSVGKSCLRRCCGLRVMPYQQQHCPLLVIFLDICLGSPRMYTGCPFRWNN